MRRFAFLLALVLVATPALAGPYLFELLEIKSYRAAWDTLFRKEKNVPEWLTTFTRTNDGVATPSTDVQIDGQDYVLATVCKPHDCGANMLTVVFAQLGEGAWALLEEDTGSGTKARYFGHPGKAMSEALKQQAANQ